MNAVRAATSLLGVAMTLFGATAAHPALAQVLPPPTSPPGLTDLLAHPSDWLMEMVNGALVALGQKTTGDIVGFMNWLMGSGNVISQTPPGLTYANPTVVELGGRVGFVGNIALGAIIVFGGVNAMLRPHIRAPYHGVLELAPRVVLCAILLNTSLLWGRFVIDLNNALCAWIGAGSIPGWDTAQHLPGDAGSLLLNMIAMAIYLVMSLLLTGQMLMRLALVDALLVIGPLALLCWALPQTYGWARLWFSTFFATVFVQAVQVVVLRLGSDLIQRLPVVLQSFGSDPADTSRIWLTTLLLGVAVLQLTRKVPRLMPGVPGGIGVAETGGTLVRQISLVLNADRKKGGR